MEQKKTNPMIYIGLGIIILVAILFPTPRVRTEYEFKRDLEGVLDCSWTLADGNYRYWDLTDMPKDLVFEVSITSTEEVTVEIRTASGTLSKKTDKFHNYKVYADGPSLRVSVTNPSVFGLGASAVVSGDMDIYHEYEDEIRYTEWLPWWMN